MNDPDKKCGSSFVRICKVWVYISSERRGQRENKQVGIRQILPYFVAQAKLSPGFVRSPTSIFTCRVVWSGLMWMESRQSTPLSLLRIKVEGIFIFFLQSLCTTSTFTTASTRTSSIFLSPKTKTNSAPHISPVALLLSQQTHFIQAVSTLGKVARARVKVRLGTGPIFLGES